jgi:hypothetical protein
MTTKNVKKCDNCGGEHIATSLKVSLGEMQLCPIYE